VQHFAMRVGSMEELLAAKKKLQGLGIEVLGPADHKICKSIYFHDPSGHRLELAYPTETPEMTAAMRNSAEEMLGKWDKTKRAVPNAI
jgi:catechol-2,3-dioxygenase